MELSELAELESKETWDSIRVIGIISIDPDSPAAV